MSTLLRGKSKFYTCRDLLLTQINVKYKHINVQRGGKMLVSTNKLKDFEIQFQEPKLVSVVNSDGFNLYRLHIGDNYVSSGVLNVLSSIIPISKNLTFTILTMYTSITNTDKFISFTTEKAISKQQIASELLFTLQDILQSENDYYQIDTICLMEGVSIEEVQKVAKHIINSGIAIQNKQEGAQ